MYIVYKANFFSRLIDLGSDELLSRNKLLPSPKAAKNLQVPKLTIKKVEECGDCIEDKRRAPFKRVFDLTIETNSVALYVWLEAEGIYVTVILRCGSEKKNVTAM